jgi:hypothetical protein
MPRSAAPVFDGDRSIDRSIDRAQRVAKSFFDDRDPMLR